MITFCCYSVSFLNIIWRIIELIVEAIFNGTQIISTGIKIIKQFFQDTRFLIVPNSGCRMIINNLMEINLKIDF